MDHDQIATGPVVHPLDHTFGVNDPLVGAHEGNTRHVGGGQPGQLLRLEQCLAQPRDAGTTQRQIGVFVQLVHHHVPHLAVAGQQVVLERIGHDIRRQFRAGGQAVALAQLGHHLRQQPCDGAQMPCNPNAPHRAGERRRLDRQPVIQGAQANAAAHRMRQQKPRLRQLHLGGQCDHAGHVFLIVQKRHDVTCAHLVQHPVRQPTRQGTRAAQADQPVAAIVGRAKDGVVIAQRLERLGDVRAGDARHVSPDHTDRPARLCHHPRHPVAQITLPLRPAWQMRRPDAAGHARTVGGNGQNRGPARVVDGAQQAADLMAEPPCGGGHADVAAKPGFHTTRPRLFEHDHQSRLHKVSSMSR